MPSNFGVIGPTGFPGQPVQFLYVEQFEPRLISQIDWYMPLTEPVKRKPALTRNYDHLNYFSLPPMPVVNTTIAVSSVYSGPVFKKTVLYQSYASPPEFPTVSFSWFEELSIPVRQKPALRTAAQNFFEMAPSQLVSFSWFEELSIPVRQKPGLRAAAQNFLEMVPSQLVSFSWFEELSLPVRQKPGLRTSAHLAFTAGTDPIPNPAPVVAFDFYMELSVPRSLSRKGLGTVYQLQPATDIFTTTSTIVSIPMGDTGPLFGRKILYPSYASPPEFPQVSTVVPDFGWFMALSNPRTMAKRGLATSAQLTFVGLGFPIIPSYGWFMPLATPQKLAKQGLKAQLQQTIGQGAIDEIYQSRSTGPLYINHRSGRPATFWKGRRTLH